MALHPDKTKFMIFNFDRDVTNFNFDTNIYINCNNGDEETIPLIPLERIEKTSVTPAIKFLGIYIDPALNFQFHTKHLTSKIANSLFVMRSIKNTIPTGSLKTLYYSLVHSHLMYGIHIWSVASADCINK